MLFRSVLQHICGWCFAKKHIFHTRKMENGFLCNEKENFLRQHYLCFQDACLYGTGHILANYAMDVAITPVIWLESQESS